MHRTRNPANQVFPWRAGSNPVLSLNYVKKLVISNITGFYYAFARYRTNNEQFFNCSYTFLSFEFYQFIIFWTILAEQNVLGNHDLTFDHVPSNKLFMLYCKGNFMKLLIPYGSLITLVRKSTFESCFNR